MPAPELPEQFNVVTALVDSHLPLGRGPKPALLCTDQIVNYQQLADNINRMGNALRALGVRMEQRVATMLPDCPEVVYAFLGAMKIGAVAVPLNTMLGPREYQYLLNDCRAHVLVVAQSLLHHVMEIRENLVHLEHIVVVGDKQDGPLMLNELMAKSSPELKAANTSKDDAAFWLYSSGTTGGAKAAVHLHHDMIFAADLYARDTIGLRSSDVSFSSAKTFFAYGLGNGLYFPLRTGGTTVLLPERPLPEMVFSTIARFHPTVFYSVPTSYANMLHYAEKTGIKKLGRVRMCVSAGELLPAALFEKWKARFGVEIVDGIGSTEILHIYISNRPGQVRPGSTGQVVPGFEAKILDEQGHEVPVGQTGTLHMKGDSIAAGYWNHHDLTKSIFQGEWINTRDKFSMDSDGFFWYGGRTDDMFKVSGMMVFPSDVETVLQHHPAVIESGVIGVPDADGLTKVQAYVVLKDQHEPTEELVRELQLFVKAKTNPHKYPRSIFFVQDLPKTANGKIQRYKLRELAAKGELPTLGPGA